MKFMKPLMKAVEYFLTSILVFDTAVVFLQVICRYVFNSPLGWTEQICRLLFLWGVLIGIPVVFYNKADIVFDLLFNALPFKARKVLASFFSILGVVFSVFYFICGYGLVAKTGMRMTAGIEMPMNVLYIAQPICAFLLAFVFLDRLLGVLRWEDKSKEVQK